MTFLLWVYITWIIGFGLFLPITLYKLWTSARDKDLKFIGTLFSLWISCVFPIAIIPLTELCLVCLGMKLYRKVKDK